MSEKVRVTVVGSGYVSMSLAVLLAQHNDVTVLDIDPDRVDQVNRRESTVADAEIEAFLKEKFGISDTEASLQRTGIFARMQELGVVKRVKEGRTVIYEVVN